MKELNDIYAHKKAEMNVLIELNSHTNSGKENNNQYRSILISSLNFLSSIIVNKAIDTVKCELKQYNKMNSISKKILSFYMKFLYFKYFQEWKNNYLFPKRKFYKNYQFYQKKQTRKLMKKYFQLLKQFYLQIIKVNKHLKYKYYKQKKIYFHIWYQKKLQQQNHHLIINSKIHFFQLQNGFNQFILQSFQRKQIQKQFQQLNLYSKLFLLISIFKKWKSYFMTKLIHFRVYSSRILTNRLKFLFIKWKQLFIHFYQKRERKLIIFHNERHINYIKLYCFQKLMKNILQERSISLYYTLKIHFKHFTKRMIRSKLIHKNIRKGIRFHSQWISQHKLWQSIQKWQSFILKQKQKRMKYFQLVAIPSSSITNSILSLMPTKPSIPNLSPSSLLLPTPPMTSSSSPRTTLIPSSIPFPLPPNNNPQLAYYFYEQRKNASLQHQRIIQLDQLNNQSDTSSSFRRRKQQNYLTIKRIPTVLDLFYLRKCLTKFIYRILQRKKKEENFHQLTKQIQNGFRKKFIYRTFFLWKNLYFLQFLKRLNESSILLKYSASPSASFQRKSMEELNNDDDESSLIHRHESNIPRVTSSFDDKLPIPFPATHFPPHPPVNKLQQQQPSDGIAAATTTAATTTPTTSVIKSPNELILYKYFILWKSISTKIKQLKTIGKLVYRKNKIYLLSKYFQKFQTQWIKRIHLKYQSVKNFNLSTQDSLEISSKPLDSYQQEIMEKRQFISKQSMDLENLQIKLATIDDSLSVTKHHLEDNQQSISFLEKEKNKYLEKVIEVTKDIQFIKKIVETPPFDEEDEENDDEENDQDFRRSRESISIQSIASLSSPKRKSKPSTTMSSQKKTKKTNEDASSFPLLQSTEIHQLHEFLTQLTDEIKAYKPTPSELSQLQNSSSSSSSSSSAASHSSPSPSTALMIPPPSTMANVSFNISPIKVKFPNEQYFTILSDRMNSFYMKEKLKIEQLHKDQENKIEELKSKYQLIQIENEKNVVKLKEFQQRKEYLLSSRNSLAQLLQQSRELLEKNSFNLIDKVR